MKKLWIINPRNKLRGPPSVIGRLTVHFGNSEEGDSTIKRTMGILEWAPKPLLC